ncbi:MAG: transposase [Gammaproteobacteria bacterium]
MSKREYRRFTAEQKIEILREAEQPGVTVSEVCRRHGLSPSVLYRWRAVAQGGSDGALKRDAQRKRRKDDVEARYKGGDRPAPCRGDGNHRGEFGAEKKDLRLDDLSRIPAETKALVMQIVAQTRKRSGWRAYRTLAALGIPAQCVLRVEGAREPRGTRSARDTACTSCCPRSAPRSVSLHWNFRDRLSKAHLDDGRCGSSMRRGKHGLPSVERCGSAVAMEAFGGLER